MTNPQYQEDELTRRFKEAALFPQNNIQSQQYQEDNLTRQFKESALFPQSNATAMPVQPSKPVAPAQAIPAQQAPITPLNYDKPFVDEDEFGNTVLNVGAAKRNFANTLKGIPHKLGNFTKDLGKGLTKGLYGTGKIAGELLTNTGDALLPGKPIHNFSNKMHSSNNPIAKKLVYADEKLTQPSANFTQGLGNFLGEAASLALLPGGNIAKGSKLVSKAGRQALKFAGAGRKGKMLSRAVTGGLEHGASGTVQGGILGTAKGINDYSKGETDLKGILKEGAKESATWGALGAGFGGAGKVLKPTAKHYLNVIGEVISKNDKVSNSTAQILNALGLKADNGNIKNYQELHDLLLSGKEYHNATPEQLKAVESFKNLSQQEKEQVILQLRHGIDEAQNIVLTDVKNLADDDFINKYGFSKEIAIENAEKGKVSDVADTSSVNKESVLNLLRENPDGLNYSLEKMSDEQFEYTFGMTKEEAKNVVVNNPIAPEPVSEKTKVAHTPESNESSTGASYVISKEPITNKVESELNPELEKYRIQRLESENIDEDNFFKTNLIKEEPTESKISNVSNQTDINTPKTDLTHVNEPVNDVNTNVSFPKDRKSFNVKEILNMSDEQLLKAKNHYESMDKLTKLQRMRLFKVNEEIRSRELKKNNVKNASENIDEENITRLEPGTAEGAVESSSYQGADKFPEFEGEDISNHGLNVQEDSPTQRFIQLHDDATLHEQRLYAKFMRMWKSFDNKDGVVTTENLAKRKEALKEIKIQRQDRKLFIDWANKQSIRDGEFIQSTKERLGNPEFTNTKEDWVTGLERHAEKTFGEQIKFKSQSLDSVDFDRVKPNNIVKKLIDSIKSIGNKPNNTVTSKTIRELCQKGESLEGLAPYLMDIEDVVLERMPEEMKADGLLGRFDGKANKIYMNTDKTGGDTASFIETFMHEVEHAKQYNETMRILNIPEEEWTKEEIAHLEEYVKCREANNVRRDFYNANQKVIDKVRSEYNNVRIKGLDATKKYLRSLNIEDRKIFSQNHKNTKAYFANKFETDARNSGNVFKKGITNENTSRTSIRSNGRLQQTDAKGVSRIHRRRHSTSGQSIQGNRRRRQDEWQKFLDEGGYTFDSKEIGLSGIRRAEKARVEQEKIKQESLNKDISTRKESPSETVSKAISSGDFSKKETKNAIESILIPKSSSEQLDYLNTVFSSKTVSIANKRRRLNRETERIKIKYGILTEEQAKNRLAKQTKSSDGTYYHTGFKRDGKNLSQTGSEKVGIFGKKKRNEVTTKDYDTGYAQDIQESIKAHYVDNIMSYIKKNFAKPVEQFDGFEENVLVNENMLANMIFANKSKDFFKMLSNKDFATLIEKGLGKGENADYWKEFANRNSEKNLCIPKVVFEEMFKQNTKEITADYIKLRKNLGETINPMRYICDAIDAGTNLFKKGVLGSTSFVLNNRVSNQIFLGVSSDDGKQYIKSVVDALTTRTKDMPSKLKSNIVSELLENGNIRKSNTGNESFDRLVNILNGDLIDESILKNNATRNSLNTCLFIGNTLYHKLSERIMKFNEIFERFERKQAVSIAINQNKKDILKKTGQQVITTKELLKTLDQHPELEDVIVNRVEDILGNYRTFSHAEKTIFKRIVPFYSWYRTLARHHVQLAKRDPVKWAMVNKLMYDIESDDTNDKKSYQRGSIGTGVFDKRSNQELVVNKASQIPYGNHIVNDQLGSLNNAIKVPAEAIRGKHFFLDQDITSKNWVKKKGYFGDEDVYINTKDPAKQRDRLPNSVRLGYVGKELVKTAFPILNSGFVKAEENTTGAIRSIKEKNGFLAADKKYDASFGGYYDKEKAGKAKYKGKAIKRHANNNVSQKTKLLNEFFGIGLQNKQPLNKNEKKKKYKRQQERMKNL